MLAQKLILSYSSRLLVQIFQIGASIIVARIAGASVLGTISFGLAYVTMLSFIADMGFGTAHIKLVSEGRDEAMCMGTYTRVKLFLIIIYSFFTIAFFFIQKDVFNIKFESKEHITVIFVFLISSIISQLISIPKTNFMAHTQQAKTDIPEMVQTLIEQILRIIIVVLGFRAVALAFGNLVSVMIIVPLIIFLFRDKTIGQFNKNLFKEYLQISIPVMLTAFTSTVSSNIDKVLLQFFSNSEQVGYYTAGFRVGGFVLLISQSVGILFYPLFSQAAANKDFEAIKRIVEKFERFSYIYIMPVLILATLFSEDIVRILLGREFATSAPIMVIINVAMFLRVLNAPYSSILVGLGHFKKGLDIGVIVFLAYLLLLFILISSPFFKMGGMGAALATLLSNIIMILLYRFYSKKYLPILNNKTAVLYLFFGIVNYYVFYFILNMTKLFSGYNKIFFSFGYVFLTYFSLLVAGLIRKEDIKFLRTILDYKSINQYIKTEIINK